MFFVCYMFFEGKSDNIQASPEKWMRCPHSKWIDVRGHDVRGMEKTPVAPTHPSWTPPRVLLRRTLGGVIITIGGNPDGIRLVGYATTIYGTIISRNVRAGAVDAPYVTIVVRVHAPSVATIVSPAKVGRNGIHPWIGTYRLTRVSDVVWVTPIRLTRGGATISGSATVMVVRRVPVFYRRSSGETVGNQDSSVPRMGISPEEQEV